jgi:hypothetical protein
MEIDSMPVEVDSTQRLIRRMEIEKKALEKEDTSEAKKRIRELNKKLAETKEQSQKVILQWKTEKDLITNIRAHSAEIERLKSSIKNGFILFQTFHRLYLFLFDPLMDILFLKENNPFHLHSKSFSN